jgi:phi13 family phage major tail protein
MADTSRPVKYGLTNVHYAVLGNDGEYETPVRIYGGVSLTISPEGDSSTFHADNQPYFVQTVNSGYTGTLEIAYAEDQFLQDVLGYEKTRMVCLLSLLMQLLQPLH